MTLGLFCKGIVIGFSIAAPVGPIGVLCIRRTLAEGRAAGLFSGLGAATADAIYGCIAGFGLTAVSSIMISQQMGFRLVGGAFLLYLGVRTFLARPPEPASPGRASGLPAVFASTFLLTLTNPMTIVSFAAIFAGLGLSGAGGDFASAGALVLGVFIGSASWWLMLSGGVVLLRTRIDQRALQWVNRVSGLVIAGFGMVALASAW